MKKMTKVLCALLALVLAVGAGVGGTLAWLKSETEIVTNTVTAVGALKITLDETDVDVYGVKDGDTRVLANDYKLIPGHTYLKDPTVHVQAGSEACYVFVDIVNGLEGAISSGHYGIDTDGDGWNDVDHFGIKEQMTEKDSWKPLMVQINGGVKTIFYKAVDLATAQAGTDLVVFNEIHVPSTHTTESLQGFTGKTITIDAYACQQDGFKNAADAWANTFAK